MKTKKILIALGGTLLALTMIAQNTLAWSVTLRGEITDDGGDPNLYVWFQYGLTTSYGYTTPQQTKTGTGEFSAVLGENQLQACTTYHYRAVARHVAYDDTKYGEDNTFTTPCQVTVDLKVNGSDNPGNIAYTNRTINISWTSSHSTNCTAQTEAKPTGSNVSWSGSKSTSGSEVVTLDKAGYYRFRLTCSNAPSGYSVSDAVELTLLTPTLNVITKGVVITY